MFLCSWQSLIISYSYHHILPSCLSTPLTTRTGTAKTADCPEFVSPTSPPTKHTTSALHATAPWATALAQRQEPGRPQHAPVANTPTPSPKTRHLAASPRFLHRRSNNYSTLTTPTLGSMRTGNPIAVPASWSQDSRPLAVRCSLGHASKKAF